MSVTGQLALQQAIYERLTNDATLQALINGVFDFVPANTAYPFLTIGEVQGREWDTTTTTGTEFRWALQAFSREGGRKQAITILERAHDLLHRSNFSVTGFSLILIRLLGSDIRLLDDGATYQGIARYKALLQKQ